MPSCRTRPDCWRSDSAGQILRSYSEPSRVATLRQSPRSSTCSLWINSRNSSRSSGVAQSTTAAIRIYGNSAVDDGDPSGRVSRSAGVHTMPAGEHSRAATASDRTACGSVDHLLPDLLSLATLSARERRNARSRRQPSGRGAGQDHARRLPRRRSSGGAEVAEARKRIENPRMPTLVAFVNPPT